MVDWTWLAPLGTSLLTSLHGWFENAAQDGKFDKFEFLLLGETVLRVGGLALLAYFGVGADMVSASAIGAFAHYVLSKFGK